MSIQTARTFAQVTDKLVVTFVLFLSFTLAGGAAVLGA
jgi:hypothetical protein